MPSSRAARSTSMASGFSRMTAKTVAATEVVRDREVVATFHDSLTDLRCACYVMGRVWTSTKAGQIVIRDPRLKVVSMVDETERCGYPASIFYISNRKQVWVGYSSGVIKVYSAATSREVPDGEFKRHTSTVHSITSDYGEFAFSGSADFQIIQWKSQDFKVVRFILGHGGGVRHVHCYAGQLISASDDTTVRVWKISTGESVKRIHAHSQSVRVLLPTQNHFIWTGGDDGVIQIYDGSTFELVITLEEHDGAVTSLIEIDHEVWSGSNDRTICVWHSVDFNLLRRLDDHNNFITIITKVVAQREICELWSGAADKEILIWGHDSPFDSDECQRLREDLSIAQTAFQDQTNSLKVKFTRMESQKDQLIDELNKTVASQAEDLMRCNDISTDLQLILVEKEEEITDTLETRFNIERSDLHQELQLAVTARLTAERTSAEIASTAAQVPHLKAALEGETITNQSLKELVTSLELSENDIKLQQAEVIAECEASLSAHEREITDFQKTSSLKDVKIKQQQQNLTELTIQKATSDEERQAAVMRLSEAEDLLTAERGTANILKVENERLSATVNDYSIKQKELRTQLSTQISDITSIREELSVSSGRVADLERELSETKGLSQLSEVENAQLKKRMSELTTVQSDLRKRLSESTIQQSSTDLSSALELQQSSDRIAELEDQLSDLNTTVLLLQSEKNQIRESHREQVSNDKLSRLQHLQNQNKNLSENNNELKSAVEILEKEVLNLKSSNKELLERIEEVNISFKEGVSLHSNEEQLKQANEQLRELLEDNSSGEEVRSAMKRQIEHLEAALSETENERDDALKRFQSVLDTASPKRGSSYSSSPPRRSHTSEWAEQDNSSSDVHKVLFEQSEQTNLALKKKYSAELSKSTDLQHSLDDANTQLSEAALAYETTTSELRELKKDFRKLQSTEADTTRRFEDVQLAASGDRAERDASIRQSQRSDQHLTDIKNENRRLTEELATQQQTANDEIKTFKKEIRRLEQQCEQCDSVTNSEVELYKKEVNDLKKNIKNLTTTESEQQQKLISCEQQLESTKSELSAVTKPSSLVDDLKLKLSEAEMALVQKTNALEEKENLFLDEQKALDSEIEITKDTVKVLQQQVETLNDKNENYESNQKILQTEIDDLKQKLQTSESQIATLELAASSFEDMKTKLVETELELIQKTNALDEREDLNSREKTSLELELQTSKDLIATLKKDYSELDDKTNSYEERTKSLQKEVLSNQREVSQQREDLSSQKIDNDILTEAVSSSKDQLTSLRKQHNKLQLDYATLQTEYTSAQDAENQATDQAKKLHSDLHQVEQQLVISEDINNELEKRISDWQLESEDLKTADAQAAANLRKKLSEVERKNLDLTRKLQETEEDKKEDIHTIESVLASERESNASLRKKVSELQGLPSDESIDYNLIRTELQEERNQNAILRKKINDLVKELSTTEESNDTVLSNLDSEKRKVSDLQKRFNELKQQTSETERERDSEIEALTSTLMKEQETVSTQRKKLSELQRKLKESFDNRESELEQLTTSLNDQQEKLRKKCSAIEMDLRTQQSESSSLRDSLQEEQQSHAALKRKYNNLLQNSSSLNSEELLESNRTVDVLRERLAGIQKKLSESENNQSEPLQSASSNTSTLKKENDSLRAELLVASDNNASSEETITFLKKKHSDSLRRIESMVADNTTTAQELEEQRDANSSLRKKLSDLQKKVAQVEDDSHTELQDMMQILEVERSNVLSMKRRLSQTSSDGSIVKDDDENNTFKKKISVLEKKITSMQSNKDELSTAIDTERESNSLLRKKLTDLQVGAQKNSDLVFASEQLQSELDSANSKCEVLQNRVSVMSQKSETDNTTIEQHHIKQEQIRSELEASVAEEREISAALRKRVSLLLKQDSVLDEYNVEEDLAATRDANTNLRKKMNSLQKKISQQDAEKFSEIQQLQTELESERETSSSLREQLSLKTSDSETNSNRLQEVHLQKESIYQQLETLTNDYSELKKENVSATDGLREANKKHRQLQLLEMNMRSQLEDAKIDNEHLVESLQLERDSVADQKTRVAESQKRISILREELQTARNDLSEINKLNLHRESHPVQEVEELQHSAVTLQGYLDSERQTTTSLRKKLSDITEENRCNKEAITRSEELESEIDNLRESQQSDIRTLKGDIRQQKLQLDSLNIQLSDANDDLESEKEQHQSEVSRLKQRLDKATSKLREGDTTSANELLNQQLTERSEQLLKLKSHAASLESKLQEEPSKHSVESDVFESKLKVASEEIENLKRKLEKATVKQREEESLMEISNITEDSKNDTLLESNITSLKQKLSQQGNELLTAKELSNELTSKLTSSLEEADRLKTSLKTIENNNSLSDEALEGNNQLKEELKSTQVNLEEAIQQISLLQKELTSKKDPTETLEESERQQSDSKIKLEEATQEITSLRTELENLSLQRTESPEQLQPPAESELREQLQIKTEEASRIPELEEKLQLAAEEIGELKIELQSITPARESTASHLRDELELANEEISELKKELQSPTGRSNVLREQLSTALNEVGDLKTKLQQSDDEIIKLNKSHSVDRQELELALEEIEDLKETVRSQPTPTSGVFDVLNDQLVEVKQMLTMSQPGGVFSNVRRRLSVLEEQIAADGQLTRSFVVGMTQITEELQTCSSTSEPTLLEEIMLKLSSINDHLSSVHFDEEDQKLETSTTEQQSPIIQQLKELTDSVAKLGPAHKGLKPVQQELQSLKSQLGEINKYKTRISQLESQLADSNEVAQQLSEIRNVISNTESEKQNVETVQQLLNSLTQQLESNESDDQKKELESHLSEISELLSQFRSEESLKEIQRQVSIITKKMNTNTDSEERIQQLELQLSESRNVSDQLSEINNLLSENQSDEELVEIKDQIKQLTETINDSRNNDTITELLSDINNQLSEETHTEVSSQVSSLKQQFENCDITDENSSTLILESINQLRSLLSKITSSTNSSRIDDVLESLSDIHNKLENDLSELISQCDTLRSDNMAMNVQLGNSTELNELVNKQEDFQLRIADLEAMNTRNEAEIGIQKSQLSDSRQELSENQLEINRLHDLLESCEEQDHQLEKQNVVISDINIDREVLAKEVTRLQQQLEKQANIAIQNSALSKEFLAAEQEGDLLREKIRQLEEELEEANQTAEDYRAIAKEITRKAEDSPEEQQQQQQQPSQQEPEKPSQDLTGIQQQLRSLRKANLFLALDKTKLVDSFAEAEEQVSTLKERAQYLKETIKTLNEESDNKTNEIAEWKSKCASVECELSAMSHTNDDTAMLGGLSVITEKDNEIENLTNAIAQLTTRYEEQVEISSLLRHKLDNVTKNSEMTYLKNALSEKDISISKLSAQLNNINLNTSPDLVSQLESKNNEIIVLQNRLHSLTNNDNLEETDEIANIKILLYEQRELNNQKDVELENCKNKLEQCARELMEKNHSEQPSDWDSEIRDQLRLITRDYQEQLHINSELRKQLTALQNTDGTKSVLEDYHHQLQANTDLRNRLKTDNVTETGFIQQIKTLTNDYNEQLEINDQLKGRIEILENIENPATPSFKNTEHWEHQLGEQLRQVTENYQNELRVNSSLRQKIEELEEGPYPNTEHDDEETTMEQIASILNVKAQELQHNAGKFRVIDDERINVQQEFNKVEHILKSQGFTDHQEQQLLSELRRTFEENSMLLGAKSDELQRDLQRVQAAYSSLASPGESPIAHDSTIDSDHNIDVLNVSAPGNLHIENVALKCVIQLIAGQLKTLEAKYKKLKGQYGNKSYSNQLVPAPAQVISDFTEVLGRVQYIRGLVDSEQLECSYYNDIEDLEEFCSSLLVRYSCDGELLIENNNTSTVANNSSIYDCPAAGRVSPKPPETANHQVRRVPPPSLMGFLRNV